MRFMSSLLRHKTMSNRLLKALASHKDSQEDARLFCMLCSIRGAYDFSTTGVQLTEPRKRALFMPPN